MGIGDRERRGGEGSGVFTLVLNECMYAAGCRWSGAS